MFCFFLVVNGLRRIQIYKVVYCRKTILLVMAHPLALRMSALVLSEAGRVRMPSDVCFVKCLDEVSSDATVFVVCLSRPPCCGALVVSEIHPTVSVTIRVCTVV